MDDMELVQGVRALTELSSNLNQLEIANESLQRELQGRLNDGGNERALEAALLIARANSNLRMKLAREYENKRLLLIRGASAKSDPALLTRLENAFQMDWFSNATMGPMDLDGVIPKILKGRSIEEKAGQWAFDRIQTDDIIEALTSSLNVDMIDYSDRDDSGCRSSSGESMAMPSPTIGGGSVWFDFVHEDYVFDSEPDSAIVVVAAPGNSIGSEHIKCGTLNKLVERLTDDRLQDLNLRYVFLLTYHSFTTPHELLEVLVKRYFIPNPPNATPSEILYFHKNRQKGIRLKVFSVLKKWVEDHWTDFDQNDALRQELTTLLETRLSDAPWSRKLSATILGVMQKQSIGASRHTPLAFAHLAPAPEVRQTTTYEDIELNFVDVSPLEIARQLSIRDFDLFRQIHPREMLNQAWSKPATRDVRAPNIMRMIRRFVLVSQWAQWMVLNPALAPMKRSAHLRQMIRIGEHCLLLNNFSTACAVFAGLVSTPLYRLKKLWEQLPGKYQRSFETLESVFRSDKASQKRMRVLLQEAIPPCVPHLAMFLGDLTFIEDGNPDSVKGMINFSKRRLLSERIMWIKQNQQSGYQLTRIQILQDYFEKHLVTHTEDELWKLSKEYQP